MPEDAPRREPSSRSPAAGCAIITAAILSLAFLAGFTIWSLFKLDRELARFTEDQQDPVPVPGLESHAAEVNHLNSKLETFRTDAGNRRPARLALSPLEINLAIAAFDAFKDLRGTFAVRSLDDDRLHIAISFPLRGSPLEGGYRYLNGTMIASPRLDGGELVLDIERIETSGAGVPDGFIGQMSPYRLTERYRDHPALGPWLARLSSVEVADGAVRLAAVPGAPAPDAAERKLPGGPLLRTAAVFGAVFLLFLAVAVFALRHGKRAANPP